MAGWMHTVNDITSYLMALSMMSVCVHYVSIVVCLFLRILQQIDSLRYVYIYIYLVKLWRPHATSPQKVAKEGKSPYFRFFRVGELL